MIDVGCGKGEVSRWLAEQAFPVLGIDYSTAAVENCRRLSADQGKAIEFEVADLCDEDLRFLPPRASSIADVSIASRTISGRPMRAISPVPPLQEDIFSFFAVILSILVSKVTAGHVANRN